jgi:hypothetical protein
VSEKPKSGPLRAHTTITSVAPRKVRGFPAAWAVHLAKRANAEDE